MVLRRTRALADRILFHIASVLALLPPRIQRRLAGGGPVEIDGNTLDPNIQLLLALRLKLGGKPFHVQTPEEARRAMTAETRLTAVRPPAVGAVRDLRIDGGDGEIGARHYAPPADTDERQPLLVYFHGGGFVVGDLDAYDGVCRILCRHAGVHVLSVDYRLAPEHPFPAAVLDARAAQRWAFAHAEELGADPRRVAIGGDSAGGNLAATVSRLETRDGEPVPTLQLLIYPATDVESQWPSRRRFEGGPYLLTAADIEFFERHYLGEGVGDDPLGSPLLAGDLSGLPPALVVTAGFDPLRDEGEAYAAKLREHGTPVMLRRFPELVHGFANLAAVNPASHDALVEVAGALRAALALRRMETR